MIESQNHDDAPDSESVFHGDLNGRSRCPSCIEIIPFWLNIPIISYVLLLGKSRCCKEKIPAGYFFIELVVPAASVAIFIINGISVESLFYAVSFCLCLALICIDFKTLYLPDVLVFPLMFIGLYFTANYTQIPINDSFFGVLGGYLILAIPTWIYSAIRKVDGMASGDFKLMAACGAWLTFESLFVALAGASLSTLALSIFPKPDYDYKLKGSGSKEQLPFGPGILISSMVVYICITTGVL